MDNLNKLTIVIPTRNRQKLAIRNMEYWSGKNVNIIVIDGSDSPILSNIVERCGSNIAYHYLAETFPTRLSFAAHLIKTEYAVLLSDDEFLIPSALITCIKYLDNNPEYISCGGRSLGFFPVRGRIHGKAVYPELSNRHRNESDARNRIINHMKDYAPAFSGAVTRSRVWREVPILYSEREFPIYALWELELNLVLSFAGKSITLPLLTRLRSYGETEPIRNNIPSLNIKNDLFHWWNDSNNKMEKNEFISFMSRTLMKVHSNYEGNYKHDIADAVNAYCVFYMSIQNKSFRTKLKKKLAKKIPSWLFDILQIIPKCLSDFPFGNFVPSTQKNLIEVADELGKDCIEIDYAELNRIHELLLNYHSKRN